MSDYLTALTGAGTTVAVGLTVVGRLWPAPPGRHRAKRPRLLPGEPVPALAGPVACPLLDEDEPGEQLERGDAVADESADCLTCCRSTFHQMYRDGSRRCWTCNTTTGEATDA